jgi:dTDP-4-amino-4,6-dideoxygalactose transaminase
MTIQVFVPKFRIDECLAEIRECLEKGWTGLGFKTIAFEKAWSKYSGLPFSHFLNSATSGLHLAVYMLRTKHGWAEGDEIITTPLTFVSTNHAILYEKMKPVFADVDQYLCLDPDDIERKITPRTRAVIFVGLGGNTGQYERVVEICKQHNLALILDAAHMAGTRLNGRHVGGGADCAVFSFQAVKNLPTADSGMICWDNAEDDERARKVAWLGINKDTYSRTSSQGSYKWMYDVEEVGFKYHGNSVMAALGLVSLKYLDQDNAVRRSLAALYQQHLGQSNAVQCVPVAPDCESARHFFQIRVRNRDEVMVALNTADIFPGVHYRDNTEYRMYASGKDACPNATAASSEVISLPMHMQMTPADADRISELTLRHAR